MEKIITRKSNIDTLDDLKQYRKQLRLGMAIQELQLKENVRYKVVSIPSSLLRPTPKIVVGDENTYFNTLNTSLDKITASVVKTFLPKKMGFLEKWLLGFVAKKSVKKIMENKVENPKIENEQFTPVPIAMKTTVIKEPKEISSTKTVEVKKKEKFSLKGIWEVLKASFTGFGDHKVTKISGSLAYYTVFSMAPLMVVVIALCSLFLEREAAEGQIYAQLKGFLGAETAVQMQEIIKNAAIADKGLLASIIGGVTLLIGATTVFGDIQDSINTIWGIKPKPKRGWLKMLQNRFLSFSVIVSLGFLLLVSLAVSAVLDGFSNRLRARFEDVSVILFYILNTAITFAVVTTIFAVVFKVLPDAKIRWKDVMAGAMVTAVLFMAGKFGISFYIGQSDVGGTYGAAGSLVILLLWAYYSSIILYFGAEFTKAYAVKYGAEIHPNAYAVTMKEVEVEQGGASIQEIEESKQN